MIFVLIFYYFCINIYNHRFISHMKTRILTTILFSLCIIGILYLNLEKKYFIQIAFLSIGASLSFFINLAKPIYPPQKNKKNKEAYISDINYRGTKF